MAQLDRVWPNPKKKKMETANKFQGDYKKMSNVGENHFHNLARRYSTLPFISVDVSSEKVEFWNVNATGNWHVDFEAGATYAHHLIEFMVKEDAPYFLEGVLRAMNLTPGTPRTGLEAGFIFQLASRALKGS